MSKEAKAYLQRLQKLFHIWTNLLRGWQKNQLHMLHSLQCRRLKAKIKKLKKGAKMEMLQRKGRYRSLQELQVLLVGLALVEGPLKGWKWYWHGETGQFSWIFVFFFFSLLFCYTIFRKEEQSLLIHTNFVCMATWASQS